MRIITISREFGSGGRELGKRLADALGFDYYDKEIVTAVAESMSLDENYLRGVLRKGIASQIPITFSNTLSGSTDFSAQNSKILAKQSSIIREIADKGDCVIVGRSADAILTEYDPFSIFVYADIDSRIARCKARATEDEQMTDKQWKKKIKHIDKTRAKNYDILAPTSWGDMHSYKLCVDVTNTEIKSLVPAVAEYAKIWFEKNGK